MARSFLARFHELDELIVYVDPQVDDAGIGLEDDMSHRNLSLKKLENSKDMTFKALLFDGTVTEAQMLIAEAIDQELGIKPTRIYSTRENLVTDVIRRLKFELKNQLQ